MISLGITLAAGRNSCTEVPGSGVLGRGHGWMVPYCGLVGLTITNEFASAARASAKGPTTSR
jgi:hypothetical protein